MDDVLVGALSGLACALLGAVMPVVVARLPQPAPLPEPEEGATLTRAQQTLLDEGPVPTYAELASRPGTRLTLAMIAGVSGALLGWSLGAAWVLLLVLPLVPLGAALTLIDLRCRLLPSRLILPATALVIAYGVVDWLLRGSADDLVRGLIGLAAARSVFWLLWFVRSAGMGFGDVRLAALLGFVLAYLGWDVYAVGLYAPFVIFALPGLLLAIARRNRSLLKQAYPFGPFLLAGAVLGILLGESLLGSLTAG